MTTSFSQRLVRAIRHLALPLSVYYAVTLGLPLANGAASAESAFVHHAAVVLMIPVVLLAVGCGAAHGLARLAASLEGDRRPEDRPRHTGRRLVRLPRVDI